MQANKLLVLLLAAIITSPFVIAALTADDYALYVFNSTGNNSTTAYDVSGNGRDLTIVGNPTFLQYNGYGVNATGMTGANYTRRDFGGAWEIGGQNNSWSIYGWFLPTSGATNQGTIVSTSYNSYDNRSTCQINAGATSRFICGFYNGSAYGGERSCTISNDGVPHSFAYSWNRTTNTSVMYCDNIITTGTSGGLHTGSAERSYIGQRTDTSEPLNGSVFWIGMNQRVITTAEIGEVYTLGYNYLNSTPPVANNYVNITIGSNLVRYLPANYRGLDTHEVAGYPYWETPTEVRNNTLDLAVINSFKPTAVRTIISLQNVCSSGYTGNPTNPCTFSTTNTSSYANINLVRSILGNQTSQGRKVYFNQDGTPQWLADNSSKCNYGLKNVSAGIFYYTSCDPSNFTIYANAVAQYMEAVGCTTTYSGMCVLEGRNEPYLASGNTLGAGAGQFYYKNSSVTCAQRTAGQMTTWNNTFPIYRARLGSTVEYLSPSFNYGYHVCGINMSNTFMTEHSYLGNASPDFMNTHEYSSQDPPNLDVDFRAAQDNFTLFGWGSNWKITEGNLNNGAPAAVGLCTYSPEVCKAALTTYMIRLIQNTTNQGWVLYDYDTDESYSTYNYPDQLYTPDFLKPTGLMLNATKYIDDTQGEVRTCTVTGDIDLTCSYVQKNSTQGILIISNYQNSTTLVQNITITSGNVTGAISNTNASVYAAGSGVVQNIMLGKYGFDGYNLTYESADTSAPLITNRSEYSNSSLLQINITCNEACNASINYGTVSTVLGNQSNITSFSLTNQSWNLSPLFANTNYHYNITVCDALNNCATYGVYSEFTKNTSVTNISFTSNTPSISTSVNEPENVTFAYSIDNPYSLATTTTWRVNGTVQTSTDTSFTLIGNYTSNGTWIINVTVAASGANTITYQWTLLINDTNTISYNVTSPATPLTISEPSSQVFSVTLNNPGLTVATYEWLINGTNQTSAYNSSSVTFPGSYTSDGIYNITNKVYSPGGNLNYTWILTVTNSTESSAATTACAQAKDGINGLANYFTLIGIAIVGIIISFGVWKFASGDFNFDTAAVVSFTIAFILAGIMIVVGSAIVGGAASVCG